MSKFAFQNATGFLDVEKLNATLHELAESQDGQPKRQYKLASVKRGRDPKLWVAGRNLDVPRELCCGLEDAVPFEIRMSFEYHSHSWAAVKYVHTKELEMAAAYLDRKHDTITDAKETTADTSGAQAAAAIGTKSLSATAGGVSFGPYKCQLTATCCGQPRFRITGLKLRELQRIARRGSNEGLYLLTPAQPAAWEKVLVPAPAGKAALPSVTFRLHLWQPPEQDPQQHAARQQQQQQHNAQQQHRQQLQQQQQRIVKFMPAKRAAESGGAVNAYAPAAKHAKSDKGLKTVDALATGAAGAMKTPPATLKALKAPGQPVAIARLAKTEHPQAPLIATTAAAQPSVIHSSMQGRSMQTNVGACNVRSSSKLPASSTAIESPAIRASAMTRIRRLWPEFSDKLEAQISRVSDVSYQLQDGTWVHSIGKLKQMLQQPTLAPADLLSRDCKQDCNQVRSEEHGQDGSVDDSTECSSDGVELSSDECSPDPSEDPSQYAAWWKQVHCCGQV